MTKLHDDNCTKKNPTKVPRFDRDLSCSCFSDLTKQETPQTTLLWGVSRDEVENAIQCYTTNNKALIIMFTNDFFACSGIIH